jgi:hypothetical protein
VRLVDSKRLRRAAIGVAALLVVAAEGCTGCGGLASIADGGSRSGGAGGLAGGGAAGAGGATASAGGGSAVAQGADAGKEQASLDSGATVPVDSAGLCLAAPGVTPSCPAWAPHVYWCRDGERLPPGKTGCLTLDLYPASVRLVCPEAGIEAGADAGCVREVVPLPHTRQVCCP